MKHFFSALVVTCAALCAQNATHTTPLFVTGQAARAVFGQVNFTANNAAVSGSTTATVDLGGPSGMAVAGNSLFVVDSNRVGSTPDNNRILVYQNLSSLLPTPSQELATDGGGDVPCPVCFNKPNQVLGQANLTSNAASLTQSGLRQPTAIASDGHILAVADTNNNRVLIWHAIPTASNVAPDTVLGQADFTHAIAAAGASGMRGPQGVWIQGTRLFVADTFNGRVLVWNAIPGAGSKGTAADYVLGEPNFTTTPGAQTQSKVTGTTAANMLSPVSVTADATHLYVADLGQNRVMIWNSIPTQTNQPADVIVGQPDASSNTANNSTVLCASTGKDSNNKPTYPARCAATLNFPRFALGDGAHLFIADGGNDRVLVFDSIPTRNAARADAILGQPDEFTDQVSDDTGFNTAMQNAALNRSGSDQIRTPTSLAWDGVDLYVSDPFDRRVVVYSAGQNQLPTGSILNAASLESFAIGAISFTGTLSKAGNVTAGITVTVTINGTAYTYKTVSTDTLQTVTTSVTNAINSSNSGKGDPSVFAIAQPAAATILLSARTAGAAGNNITYAANTGNSADLTAATAFANLQGGTQSELGPGALVTLLGTNFTDQPGAIGTLTNGSYPRQLAGVEVYFDGVRAPLLYVSPTQINAQLPFTLSNSTGINVWVRTVWKDGTETNSAAQGVSMVGGNPGIFAGAGTDPRPAVAEHYSSNGIALIDLEGTTFPAGETVTATIAGKAYTYTIQSTDKTLDMVEAGLINAINSPGTAPVTARAAGQFNRVVLTAKTAGSAGNGITVTVSTSNSSGVTATALQAATCCASQAGALVTASNPAVAGETVIIYATGLGVVASPDAAKAAQLTGTVYNGPAVNTLATLVDDAQVEGKTANVIDAGLAVGMVGVYQVVLQIDSSVTTNAAAPMYIAQQGFVSNIATIPVKGSQ
ncbi:MAG TPA: hypothetical protein VFA04_04740 [Bryobacteraceae bacterium]|nr:hypothetical protein [Bryobacteraceae bacterium]